MVPEGYDRFLAALFRQNQFAIKYDLDAMRTALAAASLSRPARRVVLIGGTNGKGRTAAHLNNLAMAAGWRVGLYTSPHLIDFRERIRLDGVPVSVNALLPVGQTVMRDYSGQQAAARGARALSYFELATLMAAELFGAAPLDLAIFEVGLGGRLDATNAFEPDVSVLTGVAFDHMAWLGDTLDAIAGEKLGIVRAGQPAVVHEGSGGAQLLAAGARERGARVVMARGDDRSPAAVARGLAEQAFAALGGTLHAATRDEVARTLCWPGRQMELQRQGVRWLVDGAHNAEATEACARWVRSRTGGERVPVVVGLSPDRIVADVLSPLLDVVDTWHVVASTSGKATPAVELMQALPGTRPAQLHASPSDAVAHAARAGGTWLCAGSLYVVGDVLAAMGLRAEDLTLRKDSTVDSAF